jgi:hypothetical protein
VFENRVLGRIFGPKRDEVIGVWRKLVFFAEYNWSDQVKEDEKGRACKTHGGKEQCLQEFVGKARRKEATRKT